MTCPSGEIYKCFIEACAGSGCLGISVELTDSGIYVWPVNAVLPINKLRILNGNTVDLGYTDLVVINTAGSTYPTAKYQGGGSSEGLAGHIKCEATVTCLSSAKEINAVDLVVIIVRVVSEGRQRVVLVSVVLSNFLIICKRDLCDIEVAGAVECGKVYPNT